MKRIKLVIICFLILLTSGCTVDYNLKINEDLSVNETVQAKESTKRMNSKTNLKGEEAVKYLYEMFKRDNENINLSSKEENNETVATASTSHTSLEKYTSVFTSDIFKDVSVTQKGHELTLIAVQTKLIGNNELRNLVYDELNVNIDVPFNVLESNADEKNGNIYTWNIKESDTPKTIKITFDTKKKKDSANISIGNEVLNIKYEYIGIGILIALILGIVIFVAIKNKKNNSV